MGDQLDRTPRDVRCELERSLESHRAQFFDAIPTKAQQAEISESLATEVSLILKNHASQLHMSLRKHCYRHDCQCLVFPSGSGRISMNAAGIECQPCSEMGNQLGLLDKRSMVLFQWLLERLAVGEDTWIIECTRYFEVLIVILTLGHKFIINYMVFSSGDVGPPNTRTRFYASGLNKQHGIVNPLTVRNIKMAFGRPRGALTGLFYFQRDDPEDVREDILLMAQRRGMSEDHSWQFLDVCNSSTYDHAQQLMTRCLHMDGSEHSDRTCDVEQNLVRTTCSSYIPALLCKSRMFNAQMQRTLTVKGNLEVQGFCMHPYTAVGDDSVSACQSDPDTRDLAQNFEVLMTLSKPQQRHMAGNGMQVAQAGAVALFTLGNIMD